MSRMKLVAVLTAWLVAPLTAGAQELGIDSDYLGISFTGDGQTPSALSLFEAQRVAASAARYGVDSSPGGTASYAVPVPLPPALFGPSIALVYSSEVGSHTPVARGWQVNVGMSITRPVGIAAAHAYTGADGEQVELYFVRGGGLDGKLVQPFDRSEEYDYVADDPAVVRAVLSGDVFTIETGGVDLPPKAVPLSMLVQAASS